MSSSLSLGSYLVACIMVLTDATWVIHGGSYYMTKSSGWYDMGFNCKET